MIKVMLDCGAYSAWSLWGNSIDLNHYIDFNLRNKHLLHCCINLDVIPGANRQRELDRDLIDQAAEASYRNQQKMKDKGLAPIPVFHEGEDFSWLRRYCEDGESYIALAPFAGAHHCIPWLDECFAV